MWDNQLAETFSKAVVTTISDRARWLVALERESVDATVEECFLCSGLVGALVVPGMSTVSQEAVAETIDEHRHYKWAYVELFRLPAHAERGAGGTRIVPEMDQALIARRSGYYRVALHDGENNELMWLDIGPMSGGSRLSSMVMVIAGDS